MNLNPVIQERIRQLLGLTGAPSIDVIEAIQPVAVIAGYTEGRQPQNESGDMLSRVWVGGASKSAVAGNYGFVAVRANHETTLLWIRRIIISNTSGAGATYVFGRGVNATAGAWGTAGYTDDRLPAGDIGVSVAEIHSGHQAGQPVGYGKRQVTLPTGTTERIDVDYILHYPAGNTLFVATEVANKELNWVGFEGIAFTNRV